MERFELARVLGATGDPSAHLDRIRIVEATSPAEFMTAFASAVAGGDTCLVADHQWRVAEKQQVAECLAAHPRGDAEQRECGWLGLPTGGSSGRIRWARHDQNSLKAAVHGFGLHFGVDRINVVGVLPLHHVSGLMGWLRSALTGGRFFQADWKRIAAGEVPALSRSSEGDFISLVPTQLEKLLNEGIALDWLRQFRAVLIGGGPSWNSLWEKAEKARLPLCFSYGATETAAMVCAQRPGDFERGLRDSGRPMPHAVVSISPDGGVEVCGQSVFRGYFPSWRNEGETWNTGDIGQFNEHGGLEILGRSDDVIISGGKKIAPLEVERILRASGEFLDVVVMGCPDSAWGSRVVAAYPYSAYTPDWDKIRTALEADLARYKHPKEFRALRDWPRNAQGKINRAEIRRQLIE